MEHAGTDAGTPFNRHGDLALELALMVDSGLTPMQTLVVKDGVVHRDELTGTGAAVPRAA